MKFTSKVEQVFLKLLIGLKKSSTLKSMDGKNNTDLVSDQENIAYLKDKAFNKYHFMNSKSIEGKNFF